MATAKVASVRERDIECPHCAVTFLSPAPSGECPACGRPWRLPRGEDRTVAMPGKRRTGEPSEVALMRELRALLVLPQEARVRRGAVVRKLLRPEGTYSLRTLGRACGVSHVRIQQWRDDDYDYDG